MSSQKPGATFNQLRAGLARLSERGRLERKWVGRVEMGGGQRSRRGQAPLLTSCERTSPAHPREDVSSEHARPVMTVPGWLLADTARPEVKGHV